MFKSSKIDLILKMPIGSIVELEIYLIESFLDF